MEHKCNGFDVREIPDTEDIDKGRNQKNGPVNHSPMPTLRHVSLVIQDNQPLDHCSCDVSGTRSDGNSRKSSDPT